MSPPHKKTALLAALVVVAGIGLTSEHCNAADTKSGPVRVVQPDFDPGSPPMAGEPDEPYGGSSPQFRVTLVLLRGFPLLVVHASTTETVRLDAQSKGRPFLNLRVVAQP